ncbi:MAG: D-2-hydroxyacid dehydrogenase [Campylobacterota bacterium]
MKITILDAKTLGDDVDLSCFEKYGDLTIFQTTSNDQRVANIGESDIVITNKVILDKTVLDNCKNIKLICIAATGMNNVDLQYAKEKRVRVANVAGYSTKSVTQHTFAMLFYLLEQLRYYDEFVKDGKWEANEIFTNIDKPFYEISGKKWGIIGMGAIGSEVAKVATAFGCEVQYYSTSGQNSKQPYTQCELAELLSSSDIVSIHAPLNDNTQNLLATDELAMMKQDAVVINVGRGKIVDEEALAQAIDRGQIYGALDVTAAEPLPNSSPLLQVKNKERLLITPHIAWTSVEARKTLIEGIEKNIKDYLRDHTL